MKSTFVLLTLLGICVSGVLSDVGLDLIQGSWTAQVRNADVPLLTDTGIGTICRDQVPPECEAEIPLGNEELTIDGTSLRLWYTSTPGIITKNQSAEVMPSCAALGLYPVEYGVGVESGEIDSYNRFSGHLVFQDARKPDNFQCLLVKYQLGPKGPYVDFTTRVAFQGTLERLVEVGVEFRCTDLPEECKAVIDENNTGDLDFANRFTLTCSDGPCMDVEKVLKSACVALD